MKSDFQRELDDIFCDLDPKVEAEAHLALDIASQFTALRLRRGLSQGQLAERLGKSQQAISKIENPNHGGHNLARLKEVVEALDATLEVTLVPREDLEAYRAVAVPKPALDEQSFAAPSLANASHPAAAGPRTSGLQGPASGPVWRPPTDRLRTLRSLAPIRTEVVSFRDHLAKRHYRERARG